MATPERRAAVKAAGPRILMAAGVAVFIIAIVTAFAWGANPVVVSLIGVGVLIACGVACAWTWRLGVRQERALQRAVCELAESRGAGPQPSERER